MSTTTQTNDPGETAGADQDPIDIDAPASAKAVAILTSMARQTRVRGAGTLGESTEPIDFADAVAQVLTAVAANVGGVETLLSGRPGSWEADLVRRLVDGTAGGDDQLVAWRTDPVRLCVDAEDAFFGFGISDLFDQERDEAVERTFDQGLTDAQRAGAEWLHAAMERLREQDEAAYAESYRTTAQRYLTELGATCGLEIVTAAPQFDGLAEQVDEYTRQHTPLPMTGAAPDWSQGTPADALRRAGLTYTARAGQTTGKGDRA